jgi:hypothetical protein
VSRVHLPIRVDGDIWTIWVRLDRGSAEREFQRDPELFLDRHDVKITSFDDLRGLRASFVPRR